MSASRPDKKSGSKKSIEMRKEKLSEALRSNLRRRKQSTPKTHKLKNS